jgi:hypothetical protein
MLLACAVLVWVMGSELLIDIWQAHALLLPFLLFVVLAVGIAEGGGWCVPGVAAVASLLVQTHVSYVFVVVAIGASAIAALVLTHRPLDWAGWRAALTSRIALVTIAVLAVVWAQPIVEQLFGRGKGNLSRLATNASGGDVRVGLDDGVRLAARILVQPPWRLRSGYSTLIPQTGVNDAPGGPTFRFVGIPSEAAAVALLFGLVALLAVLGWSCHRRRLAAPSAACWIAAGGTLSAPLCLAVISVGQVGFAQHHVRWMWAFGVFIAVTILWSTFELIVARWPSPVLTTASVITPLAFSVVAALAAVPYLAQEHGPVADYAAMPALRRVFRDLEPLRAAAPVVYDTSNVRVYEPYSSAVMMRLQELGIEFRVTDDGMVRQLGERRRADGTERTTIFQLEALDALHYDGPACTISLASRFAPEEEAALGRTRDAIVAALVRGDLGVRDGPSRAGADRFAAARAGDPVAARTLVDDGTLGDWVNRGLVVGEVPGVDSLESALARVYDWVVSTYRLLAVGSEACPTSS